MSRPRSAARSSIHGGELGRIRRVETAVCFPLPRFSDIRYDFGLAGGALMDHVKADPHGNGRLDARDGAAKHRAIGRSVLLAGDGRL